MRRTQESWPAHPQTSKADELSMDPAPSPDQTAVGSPAVDRKQLRLRFKTLRGKLVPPDFMLIDEALDRLGNELFGDDWRNSSCLEHLPFLFLRNRTRVC